MGPPTHGDAVSESAALPAKSPIPAGGLQLHLGSGPHAEPGWVNVDKSWVAQVSRSSVLTWILAKTGVLSEQQCRTKWPSAVLRLDLTSRFEWADGSVRAIYSSHMLEHFSRSEASRMLLECKRVLAAGGVLRLALPNLHAAVQRYVRDKDAGDLRAADTLIDFLYFVPDHGEMSPLRRVGVRLLHRPHRWMYDAESMLALLSEIGFDPVQECEFRQGACPDLETLETRTDDIFPGDTFQVEAFKP